VSETTTVGSPGDFFHRQSAKTPKYQGNSITAEANDIRRPIAKAFRLPLRLVKFRLHPNSPLQVDFFTVGRPRSSTAISPRQTLSASLRVANCLRQRLLPYGPEQISAAFPQPSGLLLTPGRTDRHGCDGRLSRADGSFLGRIGRSDRLDLLLLLRSNPSSAADFHLSSPRAQ